MLIEDHTSRSLLASQRSQVQELACLLEVARAGALAGGDGRGARPAGQLAAGRSDRQENHREGAWITAGGSRRATGSKFKF